MNKSWQLSAFLGGAAVVFFGVLTFGGSMWEQDRSRVAAVQVIPRPFDSKMWFSENATLRHEIAKYLTDTKVLVGRTRAEIIAQLGPAPPEYTKSGSLWWPIGQRERPDGDVIKECLSVSLDAHDLCTVTEIEFQDE